MSEQAIPPADRSSLFNLPLVNRAKAVKDLLLAKLDGLHEQLQTLDSTVQTFDSKFKTLGTTANALAKNDIALLEATIGLIETLQENQQSVQQQNQVIMALLRQTIASVQQQERFSSQVLPEMKMLLQEIRQQEQANHQVLEQSLQQNAEQITQHLQLTEQKIEQSSQQIAQHLQLTEQKIEQSSEEIAHQLELTEQKIEQSSQQTAQHLQLTEQKIEQSSQQITHQLELTEQKIEQSSQQITHQLELTEQTIGHVAEHQTQSLKTALSSIRRQNSSILHYTSKFSRNGKSTNSLIDAANRHIAPSSTPAIASAKPFYFFHIPKTAGTSLRFWLLELFAQHEYLECFFLEDLEKIAPEKLAQHRFFSGHLGFSLCQALPKQPDIVTWLREPIEREISQYNYLRQKRKMLLNQVSQRRSIDYIDAASQLSITELLQSDLYLGYYDNLQVRYLSGIAPGQYGETNTDDTNLSLWTRAARQECNDEMLEAAKQNLLGLLHFGLCESMQASIELLCYRASWAPRKFDLHLNRGQTGAQTLANQLSTEELAIIREVNKYDLALYEFAKAEFNQRYQEMWQESLKAKAHHFDLSFDAAKLPETLDPFVEQDPQISTVIADFVEENFQRQHNGDKQSDWFNVRFSDAAFLSGWYPREYDASLKTWLRWAGPEPISYLYLPLKAGSNYRISFWVLLCMALDIQESIAMEVEGQSISLQYLYVTDANGDPRSLLTGIIPAELISEDRPYTKIILKTNRVVPLEVAESDPPIRYVSFATNGLTVEPVTIPSVMGALLQANQQLQQAQTCCQEFEMQFKQAQEALQAAQMQAQHLEAKLQEPHGNETIQTSVQQPGLEQQLPTHMQQMQETLQRSQTQTQHLQGELQQTQKELERTKRILKKTQIKLERVNDKRKQFKQQLEQTRSQLNHTKAEIEAMETSKFWKIRKSWFKVKQSLGLSDQN
jgi:chemotaxis protein histidine kinase CheA